MNKTTINKEEVNKFNKIADEWWDPKGKFKPLHKFNPVRIQFIKDNVKEHFKIKSDIEPFKGLKILDVGCGGGLLSEPMARLGAKVTGIDASENNIKVAKAHLKKSKLKIEYLCSSPEKIIKKENKFDVILNMEIVEHVDNLDLFVKKSSSLLKRNGIMFVATINKTLKSYLFAIIGAEYVLKWLPIGTHQWEKFVKPEDITQIAKNYALLFKNITGVKFDLLKLEWKKTKDTSVNYISQFIKN